ncbi:MAG: hypothetical protein P8Y45_11415, partial [Exilibacterium sp.]
MASFISSIVAGLLSGDFNIPCKLIRGTVVDTTYSVSDFLVQISLEPVLRCKSSLTSLGTVVWPLLVIKESENIINPLSFQNLAYFMGGVLTCQPLDK